MTNFPTASELTALSDARDAAQNAPVIESAGEELRAAATSEPGRSKTVVIPQATSGNAFAIADQFEAECALNGITTARGNTTATGVEVTCTWP